MIKKANDIFGEYCDQEKLCKENYGKWWADLFTHYGFKVDNNTDKYTYGGQFKMEYNGKKYFVQYNPSHYMGIKIWSDSWFFIRKCQTESGVFKFLKELGIKP